MWYTFQDFKMFILLKLKVYLQPISAVFVDNFAPIYSKISSKKFNYYYSFQINVLI